MPLSTDQATIILFEPQDAINIGAAARACSNCGIRDMRLIRPRRFEHQQALISAPGCESFFRDNLTIHDSWESAVEGVHRTYALTARSRSERQARMRLAESMERCESMDSHDRFAFVFGREDHGLPNSIVDRCDAYVTLESTDHASFNLAQAVLLVVHAVFRRSGESIGMGEPRTQHAPASHAALERMMLRAEDTLDAIGFFKGSQRDNVLRTVRRVFLKAEMDEQELATWFGIWVEARKAAERS